MSAPGVSPSRAEGDGPPRLLAGLRGAVAFLRGLYRRERPREVSPAPARPFPWEAAYPEGLSWDLEVAPRPLYAILDAAATAPDKLCLEFLGKRYTYGEVAALVKRAAKGLAALGVGKGVRVGLLLPNSPYFVICYHAILEAGGTVVNFNPLYAEREIAHQIRDSETRTMITLNLKSFHSKIVARLDDGALDTIVVCRMSAALPFPGNALFGLFKRKEVADIPSEARHIAFERLIDNDGAFTPPPIDPARDIAVVQYTGGTTGTPKGAMLSHAALYANTVQTRMWATSLRSGEVKMLAVLPLFHVFGMTGVMNVGLHCAGTLILLPRFKVTEVLKAIDKHRPNVFMGVPTMYSAINARKDLASYDLSSLEVCISGGAPLPRAVKTRFEKLTGCTLVEGYGLSEAGPVCTINPFGGRDKPGSIGVPLPATIVEIVALDEATRTLPPGERGEICIVGPQLMTGYWKREAETAEVLAGGRLRTGDVGYIDDDGYVFLIDRIKDVIISGGFNVYPRMVEEAIFLHPAVEGAAVCGIPDRHRGEVIKAFVTVREGATLTAAELRAFLKDKLAPFKQPREIEFRDSIPKTLVGKPLRRALVAEHLARREARRKTARTKAPAPAS